MLKLAVCSDLHLDDVHSSIADSRISIINEVEADYLLIMGDICNNRNAEYYLSKMNPKVKKILIVKGNHEFFNNDLGYKPTYPDNVLCIDETTHLVDGDFLFVGDVLWTNIPEVKMNFIENYMPEYSNTLNRDGEHLMCIDTNTEHIRQRNYISDIVLNNQDKKVVVMTHHSPSYNGVTPQFREHPSNCAFHSDAIEHFRRFDNIVLWAHGHTHAQLDYEYIGIRVVCQPFGYHHEASISDLAVKYINLR